MLFCVTCRIARGSQRQGAGDVGRNAQGRRQPRILCAEYGESGVRPVLFWILYFSISLFRLAISPSVAMSRSGNCFHGSLNFSSLSPSLLFYAFFLCGCARELPPFRSPLLFLLSPFPLLCADLNALDCVPTVAPISRVYCVFLCIFANKEQYG